MKREIFWEKNVLSIERTIDNKFMNSIYQQKCVLFGLLFFFCVGVFFGIYALYDVTGGYKKMISILEVIKLLFQQNVLAISCLNSLADLNSAPEMSYNLTSSFSFFSSCPQAFVQISINSTNVS